MERIVAPNGIEEVQALVLDRRWPISIGGARPEHRFRNELSDRYFETPATPPLQSGNGA